MARLAPPALRYHYTFPVFEYFALMMSSDIVIHARFLPKVSLACYQNAIPVLLDLSISNQGDVAFSALQLRLEASPALILPKTWQFDALGAGQTLVINERDLPLDAEAWLRLNEAELVQLKLSLFAGEMQIASQSCQLEFLPRNQWAGLSFMPELLAAHVLPNDACVDGLLKQAAQLLGPGGLSAYQGGMKRAWEQASAVWSTLGGLGLDYVVPPASFETAGQKVRTPSQVVGSGLATCLDSTLLVCALLEQCGLHPVVVVTDGHAFAGVWLSEESFATAVMDDVTALRKRLALQELIVFETTWLTQKPVPSFSKAIEQGAKLLAESASSQFELLVDIHRARLMRIKPLANGEAAAASSVTVGQYQAPAFETAPALPETELMAELAHTPNSRLELWQRKLLDLSLRNNLLNFKPAKRAIKLDAPDPAVLEDCLADGASLRLKVRTPVMSGADKRDSQLFEARHHEDVAKQQALEALKRNELLTWLEDSSELDSRLTELYRVAKADLSEGGANTLFLAVGFLSWCQDEAEGRFYRAPLILVPVVLNRKSVREGFSLSLHDDEARFNPTLLQMLRQDFGLELPISHHELPKDEHGLDVRGIWRLVSQGIKEIKGWEVVEEVMLSTFSFAKYLMWKDLVDRTEQLKQNAVVRHLIETPREAFPSKVAFPDPATLDQEFSPQQTFCPLASDSSQLSAVMAASRGKDFVLIGPPGTGKSQTIANLIAQTLASGKTVLFVSEKVAALDVVYRRLRDVGLGEFCLELHSSKAKKLEVLQQLGRAWEAKGQDNSAEWAREAERLKQLRDQLNSFVQQQHLSRHNGLSAYSAIGQILLGKDLPKLGLSWPSLDQHDVAALDNLRQLVERLEVNAKAVGELGEHALQLVQQQNWSPNWQQELMDCAQQQMDASSQLQQSAQALFSVLGLAPLALNQTCRQGLTALVTVLPQAHGYDWGFVLRPDSRRVLEQLAQGMSLLQQYQQLFRSLSGPYRPEVLTLDINGLRQQWQQANDSFWPLSWLGKRKVKQTLMAYVNGSGELAIGMDLDKLQQLQSLASQIQQQQALGDKTSGLWSGLHTKLEEVQQLLAFQQQLQQAMALLAQDSNSLSQLQQTLENLLGSGNALLAANGQLGQAGTQWQNHCSAFEQALTRLAGLCVNPALQQGEQLPETLSQQCRQLLPQQAKLHAWCAWRKVRHEASEVGLLPLVSALEQGKLSLSQLRSGFETDYCRWWLNQLVEQDAVLRSFVSAEHEKRIHDFRALDERFTELTRQYIHAQLCARLPAQDDVSKNSEWGILRRELQKKRAHKPLRELISLMPTSLTKLTPCLLMSPLSIAQYLSADTAKFDLVVFDEASQIPVWDAVGAIARGKQVVMVGDPKQLPPTAFFNRGSSEEEPQEDIETDLESILDECIGANLPTLNLSWHYRSRHESLIAFSNHRYYGGGLVTFPSPVTSDRAVSLVKVAGVYEKGGTRTNKPEANALVAELVGRLRDPAFQATRFTLGVVTFNSEQQRLIEDLLDAARRDYPEIEPYFSEDALEPVFVKNLESVQGDERDIMYFSIGYGPDAQGKVSMNFGPMNKDGGERRLNVAITRARQQLRVFSSLGADAIDLSRTQAKGVHDLKRFLDFAERGAVVLGEALNQSSVNKQTAFEQAVTDALRRRGWTVHPQIGVSTTPIPFGIVDPNNPERYLAGIECDGPSYQRHPTSRDRDKLREQVLKGLGWKIIRIWANDWWLDPEGALNKLCEELVRLSKGGMD